MGQVAEFTFSEKDEYKTEATPAGEVSSVYFYDREDFEKAIIALAYKNEPRPIPASMGAIFLNGLVDHVAMKKIALVILSSGNYSAIPHDMVGLEPEAWREKSVAIRKYHELAHFIQRKLYPGNKDALRDELKADMVGLLYAFGTYDTNMAKLFLGIEGDTYREGGRLQNYLEITPETITDTKRIIDVLKSEADAWKGEDWFSLLMKIEEKYGKNL